MALTTYNCTALTGGAARALDLLSVSALADGDRAFVAVGGEMLYFMFSAAATDAENVTTHPFKVRPDDYATAGVWIEQVPAVPSASLFPVLYERIIKPARTGVDALTVYEDTVINVGGTIFRVVSDTSLDLNTNANWDSGAAPNDATRAGNDYYLYACNNSGSLALLFSSNSTVPTGYTASSSRKIAGFHCLCVAVGTIAGHSLTTFTQGDILPQSVWDLNFRPGCTPEGMVYSEAADIWVDIYLASGTGASTVSVNGGTISDTRSWLDFVDDFGAVGKRLLSDAEFQLIAAGSNEETNIAGSADPVTTGGHSDTAGRRMISNIGCEDACGSLWHWLSDQSYKEPATPGWDWHDLPGAKGSLYNYGGTTGDADIKLLAGGHWAYGSLCGSRSRYAHYCRWNAASNLGARGCARSQ